MFHEALVGDIPTHKRYQLADAMSSRGFLERMVHEEYRTKDVVQPCRAT